MVTRKQEPAPPEEPAAEGLSEAQKKDVAQIVADTLAGLAPAEQTGAAESSLPPDPDESTMSPRAIERFVQQVTESEVMKLDRKKEAEAAHAKTHEELEESVEEAKKPALSLTGAARWLFGDSDG